MYQLNTGGGLRRIVRNALASVSMAAAMAAAAANADDFAYMISDTGDGHDSFGVIDLTSGVYNECGTTEYNLTGLGVAPDGQLYGTIGNYLLRIDLSTGHLTLVTINAPTTLAFGSGGRGLFGIETPHSHAYWLTKIDYTTGQGTRIADLENLVNGYWTLSAGLQGLYFEDDSDTLWHINENKGSLSVVGTGSGGIHFTGMTRSHGTLYGITYAPVAVYAIDRTNGSTTKVADITGPNVNVPSGLAGIKERDITADNICQPHTLYR
ncbi:MAG: hypothetical protein JO208_15365 [Alphaproteobacteria bacterium]|nr:hypothetical protein [Alphaproteobacteria bacterium]